jgi:hypothetical protein
VFNIVEKVSDLNLKFMSLNLGLLIALKINFFYFVFRKT